MPVAFIEEITGRDGSEDVDTNKRYRRVFVVRTDTPQDGANVVLAEVGIAFNDPYQYTDDSDPALPVVITDASAVAIDIQVTQENKDDPLDWRVTVQYAGVEDPVSQPAEVEYSPTRYQKALTTDVNGVAVNNTAGDPFESGITVDRTRFTLTIVKPVINWNPVEALAYQDSLNAGQFLMAVHPPGFAPATCKLTWGAKRMRQQGTLNFYWLRTAVIDIDAEGWKVKVRNAGFREFNPVLSKAVEIMRTPGVPISTPALLAVDGSELAHGSSPNTVDFDGYNTMDWSTLSLEY